MATFKSLFARRILFLVVVLAFGVYVTFFSEYNYLKIIECDNEIKDLKVQIAAAEDSFVMYNKKLKGLNSGPEHLEKIVREEYHMKRDNEDVYIVKEK